MLISDFGVFSHPLIIYPQNSSEDSMQNKGAIRIFAILMALVCLYQLSFTLVTKNVERNAREATGNDPVKLKAYLDSMQNVKVYPLLGFTYQKCKENEINLGLDLKGGMNVTMEVSLVDLIKSMSNNSSDPTFNTAINNAVASLATSQKDFVTLFGEEFKKLDPNAKLSTIFTTKTLENRVNLNSSNDEVLKVIREEANGAFDRTYQILKTRIDKFGVTQPNVQKLANNRILVEMPGVTEPDRVRKLLQGTAKLEFWETFDNSEIGPMLEKVNDALKASGGIDTLSTISTDSSLATVDTSSVDSSSQSVAKNAADTTAKDSTKSSLTDQLASAGGDSTKKDTTGKQSFEQFAKENPLYAVLSPSVQQQGNQSFYTKGASIGYALTKDTSKVNQIFNSPRVKALLPKEFKHYWTVKPIESGTQKLVQMIAIRKQSRSEAAPLDGSVITDARKQRDQFGNSWEINMSMNAEGAKIWKRLTGKNIGKSIAIILDDAVYSYPNVNGEIAGGNSSITGNFSQADAEDLANVLKVGKLPAPARIIEDTVVGPTLGKEAISSGLMSFVIALILVLLFMIIYYNNAGWVADMALFVNVFFIMGILASLGAVLTLPGIAGIVLTIGLSVDANILIFERIREEMAAGKGLRLAISDGYKHAYSSIIDSNVTTLILGIILYTFGSGPIQGFATTLIIGILSSLFCAIFITRMIFEKWLAKNKDIKFWSSFSKGLFKDINIDFVGKRKTYYIISTVIIALGVVFFVKNGGLNLGVDFTGGRNYQVRFDRDIATAEVIDAVKGSLGEAPVVKTFGANNQVMLTTKYMIEDQNLATDSLVKSKLEEGLAKIGSKYEVVKSIKVGASIADDIKQSAFWSIFISCALMFLYIFIRFRRWQYGLGAVAALLHDVLIVLSVYTICNGILPFSLEIDQHFIAAILTVMGYSMTDTVVVFDRIREFVGVHRDSKDQTKIINNALNATLSRTINTSLTIFFVLLAIFIFGGEVIRGFSFALLIGIVIGTYSSICIATPIVIDFQKKEKK